MELKFRGQFNRDIDINNRELLEHIRNAILNVKSAKSISQIQNFKKLRKYKVHYRIAISKDYRIGVMIHGQKIWFVCFGNRNNFYKYFP